MLKKIMSAIIMVIIMAVLTAVGLAVLVSDPVWVMEIMGFTYYAIVVTVLGTLLIAWFSLTSLGIIHEVNTME